METPTGLEERIAWLEGIIEFVRAKVSAASAAFYQTVALSGNNETQRAILDFATFFDNNNRGIAAGQFNFVDDPTNNTSHFQLLSLYLCVDQSGGGAVPISGQISVRLDTNVAPATVTQLQDATTLWDGCRMFIKDAAGHAQTHNITVAVSNGDQIENPYSLGTYATSAVINTKGAGFEWELDQGRALWLVV